MFGSGKRVVAPNATCFPALFSTWIVTHETDIALVQLGLGSRLRRVQKGQNFASISRSDLLRHVENGRAQRRRNTSRSQAHTKSRSCYSMTRYHKLAYAYHMNYLFTGHQELSQMYSI